MENKTFWRYEVRSTIPSMPPLKESLLATKRTFIEAFDYCVEKWGDRFKEETLRPYRVPTDAPPPRKPEPRPMPQPEKEREPVGFWEVHLHNGSIHRLTSVRRTKAKAREVAASRYGQQVKNILPFGEII